MKNSVKLLASAVFVFSTLMLTNCDETQDEIELEQTIQAQSAIEKPRVKIPTGG